MTCNTKESIRNVTQSADTVTDFSMVTKLRAVHVTNTASTAAVQLGYLFKRQ
jgi:hypothetical protein